MDNDHKVANTRFAEWILRSLGSILVIAAFGLLFSLFFRHGGIIKEELGVDAAVLAVLVLGAAFWLEHDRKAAEEQARLQAIQDHTHTIRESK